MNWNSENTGVEPSHIAHAFRVANFQKFQERTLRVVENKGVEPLTPCVQGRCSDQLS
jgi:hypothetical protein